MDEIAESPVEPEEADAVASRLPIVTADGRVGDISAADLDQAQRAGARLISNDEYSRAKAATAEEEYKESLTPMQKFGLHASSGIIGLGNVMTLGLYGKALGAAVGPEAIKETEELAPTAYTVGSLAGALVPMGAISAAGKGAEAVAGLAGLSKATVFGKLTRAALTAGAENAAFGISREVNDATIENKDLAAEKLFSSAATDFLVGAALGSGISAVGQGVAAGAKAIGGGVVGAGKYVAKQLGVESLEKFAGEQADNSIFRVFGAGKKTFDAAERLGGTKAVASTIREDLPKYIEKPLREMTTQDLGKAAGKALKELSPEYNKVLSHLDEIGEKTGNKVTIGQVLNKFDELTQSYSKEYGGMSELRALKQNKAQFLRNMGLDGEITEVQAMSPVSFRELKDLKSGLAKQAYKNKVEPISSLSDMSHEVNKIISEKGNELASAGGKEFEQAYKALDHKWGAWTIMQKAADSGKNLGKTSVLGMLESQAGVMGAVGGSVIGGPVGGIVGAGLGAVARKLVRERGDFYAADILNKFATYGNVERTVHSITHRVEQAAEKAVEAIHIPYHVAKHTAIEHASEAYKEHFGPEEKEHIAKTATAMRELAASPDRIVAHSERIAAPLTAAGIHDMHLKVSQTAARATQHLAATAPQPVKDSTLFGNLQASKPRYSEMDLARYAERVHAVINPEIALHKLSAGALNRETVETVKAVYPERFREMQTIIMDKLNTLASKGKLNDISYSKRIQLGTLLEIPSDPTMNPSFVAAMQHSGAVDNASQQQKSSPIRKPIEMKSKTSNNMLDSISSREITGVK